ncbi:MAG: hypothetical protein KDK02_02835 [Rhodobacteraceae bacterium]|nr:hypothetical protein [Paracoccaceae bacterium]
MKRPGFPDRLCRISMHALAAGLIGLGLGPAWAEDPDGPALPPLPSLAQSPKNLTLLSVSSATVAPHGMWFASLGLTSKRGAVNDWDGSLALGFGLGSAEDAIGLQLTANVTSLTGGFGDSGYFQINASRRIVAGRAPLYLGAEANGLGTWGQADVLPVGAKVMLTWFPVLETAPGNSYPLMFTAGYGSHLKNGLRDPAAFFGAGIGITRNFGASVSWTGETVDLGASFTIDGIDGFNITTEVNDATDRLGSRRFTISFNFFRPGLFRS